MPQLVNIEGEGVAEFPDEASPTQIEQAIYETFPAIAARNPNKAALFKERRKSVTQLQPDAGGGHRILGIPFRVPESEPTVDPKRTALLKEREAVPSGDGGIVLADIGERIAFNLSQIPSAVIKAPSLLVALPYEIDRALGLVPKDSQNPASVPVVSAEQARAAMFGSSRHPGTVGEGAKQFASELASSFTSPEMAGAMVATGGGAAAAKTAGAAFSADMITHLPEQIEAYLREKEHGDLESQTKAALGVAASVGFPVAIAKGMAKQPPPVGHVDGQANFMAGIPRGPLPLAQSIVRSIEGKAKPPETKIVAPEIPPVRAEDFVEPTKPREGPVLESEPERMEKVVGAEEFVEKPPTVAQPATVETPAVLLEPGMVLTAKADGANWYVERISQGVARVSKVGEPGRAIAVMENEYQADFDVQGKEVPVQTIPSPAKPPVEAKMPRFKENLRSMTDAEISKWWNGLGIKSQQDAIAAGAMDFVAPAIQRLKPPVEAKAKEPKPVTPKQKIKADAKEFDDLLGPFGFSRDPTVETATGHGTESIKAKVKQSKDILAARRKAFSELRAEGLDPQNPPDRAAMLPKLKEYLAREEKLEPTPVNELKIGAEFTIQGEKYTVKGIDQDKNEVMIKDGRTLRVDDDANIAIDPGSLKQPEASTEFAPPEPTIPKLRPGEGKKAAGELFQGEDQPFNLAGEKVTDFERIAREKAAAEKAKREADELQAKQQTELPMEEPEIELRKARQSVFDLKDEDLGRLFEERFPETEELGRPKYPFANYTEFKDWMAARYAERDLDGMKEAFAEVGAPFKVQYVKENRTSPEHLRDWISHMATGSPLPTVDPPKPRTGPRPMPGAWQAPPPGATGKRPASGGPSAGAAPPGATPPPPPPPKPPPPSAMPNAPVGAPAETVRASEIIKSMAEAMDRPIRIGHIKGGKDVLGIFKSKPEVARLRRANDIPTAAHEMAHGLERMHRRALGKGSDIGRAAWDKALPADVRKEFKGLDYDPTQQRAYEGFAEFVRHWITERDTQKIAPNAHAWFENVFLNHNPELKSAMGDIRGRAEQFQKQGSIKRVESMIRFEGERAKLPLAKRIRKFGSRILTLWSDDIRPLEQIEKEMNSGQLGMGVQSPSKIARVVTQASGTRARSWAKYGMTDFSGNRVGPSLKEIFGKDGVKGDERMAIVYAVSQRALELHKRGIDPGILKADAQYVVDQLKTPERDAFAKEIRQWNEGAMNYLLDAGGISKETFDSVSSMNQSYIPFYRIFEEEVPRGFASAGQRLADTPQPIKGIKGSGREIIDPVESMLNHANQIVSTADKIRVARSLVELSEKKAGLGKYVEKIPPNKVPIQFDIGRIARDLKAAGADLSAADMDAVLTLFQNSPRTPTGGNIVSFVRNGERMFYELHPELYRVVQALDHHQIHPLLNSILGIPSRAVRLGATGLRAGFSLFTNPVRDYASLLLQSRFNPALASVKWIQQLGKQLGFRDSEIKAIWRTTGGELSQPLGMDRRSLQKEIGEVIANTPARVAWHIVKHPLEFAREALSFTEAAPRLAEFEMTLRSMGWKPGQKVTADMAIEAARNAAEVTIDFRRAGAWGRSVNQAVAFFNPSVQGLSKFNRAHITNTTRSVASGAGLITTAALTNWWINKDDPEWQRLPTWVKYGFLNFKIGGEWIRFPTPFEWWYAYGAVPMAGLNALYEKKPKEITDALGQAFRTLTPPVLPSVATPFIEAAQNKSFFTGRPIVSRAQAELVAQEQARPNTSTTARKISEILGVGGVDVSPAKIEHVLNGETGGFWSDLIGVSERLVGLAPPKESREPADIPIAGRLFVRDSASSIVDEFYTELQHLSAKQRTFNKLTSEGSLRAYKYTLTAEQASLLSRLTLGQKRMSDLRKRLNHAKTRQERQEVFALMEDFSAGILGIPKEQKSR